MTAYTIQGREVTTPVAVRDASQWSAQFLVPAGAAQDLVGYSGLEVARPLPGRAMVALAVVDYRDTDLGAYHEVAVSVVVRHHDAPAVTGEGELLREFWSGKVGAFIHQLPVDQTFTLEAGVSIWGFPKFLAEIDVREVGAYTVCALSHEGEHVLTLGIRNGGLLRLPEQTPPSYSFHDGVLRRTEWEQHGEGRGGRPGGAELTLGSHPIAKELASLGLPKRALMSSSTRRMHATFQDAVTVSL